MMTKFLELNEKVAGNKLFISFPWLSALNLSAREIKLIEIALNFERVSGYCMVNSACLASLMKCTTTTVKSTLKSLDEVGYIKSVYLQRHGFFYIKVDQERLLNEGTEITTNKPFDYYEHVEHCKRSLEQNAYYGQPWAYEIGEPEPFYQPWEPTSSEVLMALSPKELSLIKYVGHFQCKLKVSCSFQQTEIYETFPDVFNDGDDVLRTFYLLMSKELIDYIEGWGLISLDIEKCGLNNYDTEILNLNHE